MTKKHHFLTAAFWALFVLQALVIYNLTQEVKITKQEVVDARDMALKSEQYKVQLMNITMYAPLSDGAVEGIDYSGDPSLSASDNKVVPGETAAAGSNIPFGTKIYVEGLGWRIVNDRGRLIGANDIDIAVRTKEESLKFGKQERLVIINNPKKQ
ncbi:3D domain-containing protein [Candidatus Contubernalis alkaliaceticus]|uniref:3D domain-containing protein n=1 Tax=Candidatus Contubernalis alkaliaceticus TaxID=338645 RepID=UPI001F4BE43B|nr:3D domain-containing protein [Candidatus Contubernalis alkalaceticus]UNC91210.1 3D domain-containing protein [Candidatus Contubernalis alkalaceticus]